MEVYPVHSETLEVFLNVSINSSEMFTSDDKFICFSINIKANFGEACCWCTGSVAPASGPCVEGLPGDEHTSLPLPSSHTLEREAMVPM